MQDFTRRRYLKKKLVSFSYVPLRVVWSESAPASLYASGCFYALHSNPSQEIPLNFTYHTFEIQIQWIK